MRGLKCFLTVFLFSVFCFAQNASQPATLKFRLELSNPDDRVLYAFFSPNGEKLLLINVNSTQVWSAKTGKLILTFPEKILPERGLKFSWQPNGSTIAQFGEFGKKAAVRLWNIETGKLTATLDDGRNIQKFEWNKEGDKILTVSAINQYEFGTQICLWDENGKLIHKIVRDGLFSATFTKDGERLLISQKFNRNEKTIIIWDIDQWQLVKSFDQDLFRADFYDFVTSPTESPDGRFICGEIKTSKGLVCWASEDEKPRYYFLDTKETGNISFESFSPDSKSFAIAIAKKKIIEIIDTETGKVKAALSNPNQARVFVNDRWASGTVYIGDSWSPNGKVFLASDVVKRANLWNAQTGDVIAQFHVNYDESHDWFVGTFVGDYDFFTFHPSGKFLLSVSRQLVRIRNPATGELLQEIREPQTKTESNSQRGIASWSPDGHLLISAAENNKSVLIWEISKN